MEKYADMVFLQNLEWIWIGVMHLTTGSYILCNFQERKKRQKHILRLWPGLQRVQRIGLTPDIEVHPTVEGVKEGRDELKEAAVSYIQEQNAK